MTTSSSKISKSLHPDGGITYSIHYKAGELPDFLTEEAEIASLVNLLGLELTSQALSSYDSDGTPMDINAVKYTVQSCQKKSILRLMVG
jgi:hypothetical protein